MRVNIHAGHCPDGGSGACGAVGYIKESTEAREVVKWAKQYLEWGGVSVNDCTCNAQVSQNDCLYRIVKECNSHYVDMDISVHFNAGANTKANGATTGTEVLVYSFSGNKEKLAIAERYKDAMEELGFRDRGTKVNSNLYFLKKTEAPALLIEVCFVDDPDDVALYKQVGAQKIGKIIAEAIADKTIDDRFYLKTTTSLNMRQLPSIKSEVLQSVPKGKKVRFLGDTKKDGNILWHRCYFAGLKGWMSGNYLKEVE